MSNWIQLDLFTGEPIPPSDEKSEKQQRITKTTRLALAVQRRGDWACPSYRTPVGRTDLPIHALTSQVCIGNGCES